MKTLFQHASMHAATMVAFELDALLNARGAGGSDLAVAEKNGAFSDSQYDNGREQGFHLRNEETGKAVSFSEQRNSDMVVVYWGNVEDFDESGVISEELYVTRTHVNHFSPTREGYRAAALFIVGKLF